MLFKVENRQTGQATHCGVLEFIADEGMIYMPYWVSWRPVLAFGFMIPAHAHASLGTRSPAPYVRLWCPETLGVLDTTSIEPVPEEAARTPLLWQMMQNLVVQEGTVIKLSSATLPKGSFVKLQPHSKDFLDITNPRAVLETTLRNFTCLTGETGAADTSQVRDGGSGVLVARGLVSYRPCRGSPGMAQQRMPMDHMPPRLTQHPCRTAGLFGHAVKPSPGAACQGVCVPHPVVPLARAVGDTVPINYNNKRYFIDIIEAKPSDAISVVETDCNVRSERWVGGGALVRPGVGCRMNACPALPHLRRYPACPH